MLAMNRPRPDLRPPTCPRCANSTAIARHGFYLRYRPGSPWLQAIPRFRCLNSGCDCRTFSLLPPPFLPRLRHSLAFLLVLNRLRGPRASLHNLSRALHLARCTVRRMRQQARRFSALAATLPEPFPLSQLTQVLWQTINSEEGGWRSEDPNTQSET
jgi:transposase-like protein